MIVCLNGNFVPEDQAVVSVFDRGFRYGDGLFETILVRHGTLFRWRQHAERLEGSAVAIGLHLPFRREEFHRLASEVMARNQLADGLVRLQVSRGAGPHGYAPSGQETPTVVLTAHPLPPRPDPPARWKLTVSSHRVAEGDWLAGHKSCNRLLQVLAAAEARARGADEALILNTRGHVAEASASNVFWIEGDVVCTPPLSAGVLPGVTRAVVIEICEARKLQWREKEIRLAELAEADGVFLTLSSRGIVEACFVDGSELKQSPLAAQLQEQIELLISRECR